MTYPSPYQVTTPISPQQLVQAIQSAKRQEDVIYAIFQHEAIAMTPSEIHRKTIKLGKAWPITSCRRAITGLEHDGKLIKLTRTIMGPLGKPEGLWLVK